MTTYCRGYGFNCHKCFKVCIDSRGRADKESNLQVELTLRELEDLVRKIRIANSYLSGNHKSELEEKLSNILAITKNSI